VANLVVVQEKRISTLLYKYRKKGDGGRINEFLNKFGGPLRLP
jgi:hypothetical protein